VFPEILREDVPDRVRELVPETLQKTQRLGVRIRALRADDAQLLREYLRLSIFVRPGDPPAAADVVDRPEIACYVEGWRRYGDDGVLAVDEPTGADLGAAWIRLWPGPETGYGFVDRATPELGIAVRPEFRGRGIGTCLLDTLLDRASQRHRAVSLSVARDNPGVALYQRLGFRAFAESGGTLTMRVTFAP
jgi:ribosomal protein S18 acetylase RimI-like enzyme